MAKMKPMSTAPAATPGGDVDPFDSDGITSANDTEEYTMATPTTEPVEAEPAKQVRPAAPRPKSDKDDRIALLETKLAKLGDVIERLEDRIARQAANPVVPVIIDPTEERERASREYQEKCGRPLDVRVQEIVDQKYTSGKSRFEVVLRDGNGHPKLIVPAETQADARGRYMEICGINSCDMTKFAVNEIAV